MKSICFWTFLAHPNQTRPSCCCCCCWWGRRIPHATPNPFLPHVKSNKTNSIPKHATLKLNPIACQKSISSTNNPINAYEHTKLCIITPHKYTNKPLHHILRCPKDAVSVVFLRRVEPQTVPLLTPTVRTAVAV